MELRVNGALNGLATDLGNMVDVLSSGTNWLQYRTPDPYTINPQVLAQCAALGVSVVTLSPMTQTLEDIYLQVVAEDEAHAQQTAAASQS
jgi:hypothetical protein